jgi:general secretion pathway protein N
VKVRTLVLVVLGLAAFAVILVATMPASFIAQQVAPMLPPQVAIEGIKGNVWGGEASVRIGGAKGPEGGAAPGMPPPAGNAPIVIEKVQWRLKPQRLANGMIAFDTNVSSGGFEAKGELQRDGSRWRVRDFRLDGDASGFATIFPVLAIYKFSGPVTATAASLEGTEREVWGDVRIEWRDASSAMSPVRPLGSYRADWHANGLIGSISVATLSGPLRVAGAGTTTMPTYLDFRGEAGADASIGLALDPLLDQIGPRKPNGARAIEIRLR